MFKKNTAVTGFGIGHFINASTGAAVTTGTPTCKRTIDGTGGACANAAAYNANGAVWEIDLEASDMNGDVIILSFTLADCLPISYTIHTVTGVPDANGRYPADATAISGSSTAADNAEIVYATDFATNYNTTNDKWQVEANVEQWNGNDVQNLPANFTSLAIENTTGRVQIQVGTGDGKLSTSNGAVILQPSEKTWSTHSAADAADAVWDEASTGHTDAGKAGAQLWTDIDAILDDTDLIDDGTSGLAKIATDVAAILVDTGTDGVVVAAASKTGYALADATSDAVIADAVWNAATATYGSAGTYGEALEAVGASADPWLTNLPGSYGAGTAGYIIGTNLNATVSSRGTSTLDAAGVRTAVGLASANLDTQLGDIPTVAEFEARTIAAADYFVVGDYTAPDNATISSISSGLTTHRTNTEVTLSKLNDMIQLDEASSPQFTANALEQAPSGTGGDATEAKQDTIIALLGTPADTDLSTDVAAVKTVVDNLSSGEAVHVTSESVNITSEDE